MKAIGNNVNSITYNNNKKIKTDEYRRRIWPLLVGVTKEEMTEAPSLDELSTHPEYNQVYHIIISCD